MDETLKLLHPVMPFITEELWAELGKDGPARDSLLIGADLAGAAGRLHRRLGRGRDQLAGRPGRRNPLPARRDERAAVGQAAAGLRRARRRHGRAHRAPSRPDPDPGPRFRGRLGRGGARRGGDLRLGRRDGRPCRWPGSST
ncbi:MAG: class I tRNA ligase family protein [Stenotrophomonas sp.]